MTPATLTRPEVTSLIRHAVARKGGPERFARSLDVTQSHVECLLSGCAPGLKVMRLVGVVRDGECYRYAK
jgi:hypothetical protein